LWQRPCAGRVRRSDRAKELEELLSLPSGAGESAETAVERLVDFVERATHRRLPPESAFWTSLAERCLNAFLWNEGRVPPGGKVTITAKDFDHDRLQMARLWED